MKKYLIGIICFVWAASTFAAFTVKPHSHSPSATPDKTVSHGGRTDVYGCHHERATGGYHCH